MGEKGMGARLEALNDEIRDAFTRNRRVMSFQEYLDLVSAHPERQARSAAQVLKGAFDHFGAVELDTPRGKVTRYKLFDCEFDGGRERLCGHEEIQARVYRAVSNFTGAGRTNRLLFLHGPNGSAKSTFVSCLARALEHYSHLDEGALYRLNWVFPMQKFTQGGIGFAQGGDGGEERRDTFAYLPSDQIECKLRDELRDHPLLLIPAKRRRELLADLMQGKDFVVSDYLLHGELNPRNRQIYEALLVKYRGDWSKVMQHVQIERFYIERRYREGSVTVEPQMHVDARARQISLDKSLSALPSVLQAVSLYEYGGDLVDANRGIIEFSDILKRPMEAYKYLLGTVEHARVPLENAILHIDVVLMASSNDEHLNAFKETAEFLSFKGRFEFIRVPLLLDVRAEQTIYDDKLRKDGLGKPIAPHATEVAALWALLTRMRKPMADKYGKGFGELVSKLTPLDKVRLYAKGAVPDAFTQEQAKELRSHIAELWRESDSYPNYEGRTGASPREMTTLLLNAGSNPTYAALSPLAVIEELRALVRNVTVYPFLKQEALPGGYHENEKFIDVVADEYATILDDEVRTSMGLVEESEYQRIFDRYITHVTYWVRKEKMRNTVTGRDENPDEEIMQSVEKDLEVESQRDDFRRNVIARVGAWSVDHPRQKPHFATIFPKEFERLKQAYFAEQGKAVQKTVQALVVLLTDGADAVKEPDVRARALSTLERLERQFGYSDVTAREAVSFLLRRRYSS